jgi:large repetitive protein
MARRGSVRLVSSSSITTLYSSNYKGYGAIYGPTGSSSVKYAGKALDSATGLYYSGARWYDSASGRFMSEDTTTGTLNVP